MCNWPPQANRIFLTALLAGLIAIAAPAWGQTANNSVPSANKEAMPAPALQAPAGQNAQLNQISKDHAVYIAAQNNDVLTITTNHRMGSDPDFIYIFSPDGKLQERLVITTSTTVQVTLNSGTGTYKILPVNYTYIHDYSISAPRTMVVEPFDHEEFLRVTGNTDLYFQVPANTPSMTFYTHTMWSHQTVTVKLYDPTGALVQTFTMPPNIYQDSYAVTTPMPGVWRTRFEVSGYSAAGAWLEGVPNYFADDPDEWFEPAFYDTPATATLTADAASVVSSGARIGVNWWLRPQTPAPYAIERDAITDALMDTARIGVMWSYREPTNDNSDPFTINWAGFDFSGHDPIVAAYYDDIVSSMPDAMPVLHMYWDNSGGNAVMWQRENPANWTQSQRDEYAEFVLATMIHTVAPDLQTPPGTTRAYPFEYVELLNEPDLSMGIAAYQAYIDIVIAVGQRLKGHPDPRINSLKIVAPGVTPGWSTADLVMENWIGKLIDQADEYVDAINWHQYGYLRIEEHDRFAEDIAMIKGWLSTRGDGIADEEILMTELNQHGGPPTWWKRQDTFYASRWWAGASLSALRGGVNLIHYYKLIDDPSGSYNYKSMLFNNGPYDPPTFPGGSPYARKPVYEATKFINTHRLDRVIASTCDHPEIAHAVTIDDDRNEVTALLTNLFDRTIELDISGVLPPDVSAQSHVQQIYWIDAAGEGAGQASQINTSLTLNPQTIYAIVFRCTNTLADFNADGDINFFDVSAFLAAFMANDPAADFTNDGNFDFFDVSAFLAALSTECP